MDSKLKKKLLSPIQKDRAGAEAISSRQVTTSSPTIRPPATLFRESFGTYEWKNVKSTQHMQEIYQFYIHKKTAYQHTARALSFYTMYV